MRWDLPPEPSLGTEPTLDTVIVPPTRDLGDGFEVKRALPNARRRMVGPFVFFDQMGPAVLQPGKGLDVRPHPHIGLATVTYLFAGEIMHRDSLGTVQPIRPGEVNWMTAGRGIVHSERTPPDVRKAGSSVFGIQLWVALPKQHEETAPAFAHHDKEALPFLEAEGKRLRLIVGSLYGARSPVQTLSEMFYADLSLDCGASLTLTAEHEERAAYLLEGTVEVAPDGTTFEPGQLIVFKPGKAVTLSAVAPSPARMMLLGGASMDGPRHIWWNLVSSSRERIEQAKVEWKERRFPDVPGETEFIPLPEDPPPPVRYP